MTSNRLIDADGLVRPMLWLTLPALAEESLILLVGWTDWWLAGHYLGGDATKAAMGLVGYLMWLIPNLFAAVSVGALALVARYAGARQWDQARRITGQSVLSGMVFSMLVVVLLATGAAQMVRVMQLSEQAAELAERYLSYIVWVVPLIMMDQVGAANLRGAGDMVTGFLAKLVVVVINLIVSVSLVTGLWGQFEPWGWEGLAMGTAVGHATGGLIILVALVRGRAGLKLTWKCLSPDISCIRRILKIGIPAGVDMFALIGVQLIFLGVVNSLGEQAAAAHGLAIQIEACAYLPGGAFQAAAATLAGQYLGANQASRATQAVIYCLVTGGTLITVAGVSMFVWGADLAAFFTGSTVDPTTLMAAELLKIVAFAMPSLAIVMILQGGLRGAGDTRISLYVTLAGLIVVRLPLAAWFSYETIQLPIWDLQLTGLGWGVAGAWYAMALDLIFRSLLLTWRFGHGGWKSHLL